MSETSETPEQHADEPTFGDGPPKDNVLLSNKRYEQVKFLAQYVFPALAVFYISVAPLWGLPKQEEVAGTIVALDLVLGAILGFSNAQYKKSEARFDGSVVVSPNEEGNSDLNVSLSPLALASKKEILVKVDRV